MTPTVPAALARAERALKSAGIPSARAEAEWLLSHILATARAGLYLEPDRTITPAQAERLEAFVAQRRRRVPLQHILGETEFYALPFTVSPAALIPRPETEILVETLAARLASVPGPRVLDIGAGAGPIAVALAHALPGARILATDISAGALRLARANARRNRVAGRVAFLRAHLLAPFRPAPAFQAIASNPPYIPTADLPRLQPEVRDFDPPLALDGGPDGLAFHRPIVAAAPGLLAPGGWLALEVADGQAGPVAALLEASPHLADIERIPDLAGTERVLLARKAQPHPAGRR